MDLLFTPEQTAMADAVGKYLADAVPPQRLHQADRPGQEAESAATGDYWEGLATLGLFGLGIDAELGGTGLGVADEVAVFREVGRHVSPGPLLGTVLGAHSAALAGRPDLVGPVLEGATRITVAFPQPGTDSMVGDRVSGTLRVHDLESAQWALLIGSGRAALVRAGDITAAGTDAIDPTAPVTVGTVDTTAEFLVADACGLALRGTLLLAAILCGLSEAARDDSASYVRTREQFGKPVGAFQGVKHRCAEMAVRSEAAFFQAVYAALVCDEGGGQAAFHVSSALVMARDAAAHNGADNIQNHGGMGFTAEADAHLFQRRQMSLRFAFGTNREHLEKLAREERMP